jgi:outer membrane protein TolC
MRKRILLLLNLLLLAGYYAMGQGDARFTLEEAQRLAARNYPLIRQKDLVRKTSGLTIDNLRTSFLPQVNFSAQASYQSAVTEVPVKIQGFAPEPLSKDQYRALLDVSQLIYDGGSFQHQQKLRAWDERIENEQIEVAMQQLRETINQIYFSALFAVEQVKLTRIVDKDLEAGIRRVQAQVEHGTAFRSALASLQSEKLRNLERQYEWEDTRRGLLDVLSLYTGIPLSYQAILAWPAQQQTQLTETITRSEISLIHAQDSLLQERDRLIDVRNRPRLSAFVQGGYGRPGLDMLKNEFWPFYVAGLRVNWGLSSLYTSKRDREILEVQRQVLTVQEDQFLLQTRARLRQQESDIRKWGRLLPVDEEIIGLREQVRAATQAQLDNGVATAADYIREVNAVDQARLQLLMHKLKWIEAMVQYRTIAGYRFEQ